MAGAALAGKPIFLPGFATGLGLGLGKGASAGLAAPSSSRYSSESGFAFAAGLGVEQPLLRPITTTRLRLKA